MTRNVDTCRPLSCKAAALKGFSQGHLFADKVNEPRHANVACQSSLVRAPPSTLLADHQLSIDPTLAGEKIMAWCAGIGYGHASLCSS